MESAANSDGGRAPRELAVKVVGLLAAVGGALALVTSALPPPAEGSETAIRAIGVLSLAIGLLLLARRPPLGELPLAVVGLLGTALITITTREGGAEGGTDANEILYLWIVLYSFYFLSLPTALLEVAAIGVAFAWLLSSRTTADQAVTEWLVTITTLLVTGLIVARIRTRLYLHVASLRERASHDGLTGLLNRGALEERTAAESAQADRDGSPLSLLAIDVDDLKGINDALGHMRGDAVLRQVASALTNATRRHDAVARIGGDEFAVLLPGAGEAAARAVAEGLRREVARALGEEVDGVTISVGAATAREPIPGFEALLADADAAMYSGKRAGGDRVSSRGLVAPG